MVFIYYNFFYYILKIKKGVIIYYNIQTKGTNVDLPILTKGEKLKVIRMIRNLSLDEVSHITKVTKSMLGQIEPGQSVPIITAF